MHVKKFTNLSLKSKYDNIYKKGAYKKFFSFDKNSIQNSILKSINNWRKLVVLDFGCGEGDLSNMIAIKKAKLVHAVDYSSKAINIAKRKFGRKKNIKIELGDAAKVKNKYDVIVMSGVLEHIDAPFKLLKKLIKFNLNRNGVIIFLSPSFMNPRGYVWMTLQILLNVPMSLTDIHFFSPSDFRKFSKNNNCSLDFTTIAHDWGGGKKTIKDFSKRLANALRDAKLSNKKVKSFLIWMEDAIKYFHHTNSSGALMVCKLRKK